MLVYFVFWFIIHIFILLYPSNTFGTLAKVILDLGHCHLDLGHCCFGHFLFWIYVLLIYACFRIFSVCIQISLFYLGHFTKYSKNVLKYCKEKRKIQKIEHSVANVLNINLGQRWPPWPFTYSSLNNPFCFFIFLYHLDYYQKYNP